MKTVDVENYNGNEQFEAAMYAANGIEIVDRDQFRVPSSDGRRQYTVRFCGRTDDGNGKTWSCDCEAGQHGRQCKHMNLVVQISNHICDVCGYD